MSLPPPGESTLARGRALRVADVGAAADLLAEARRIMLSLEQLVQAWRAAGDVGRRSAAKLVATVALALERGRAVRRGRALALASRVVAERLEQTPGAAKKAMSEARALLAYGGVPAPTSSPEDDLSSLVAEIDAALCAVNMADVLRARASRLHGAHGGRPPLAQPLSAELRRRIGEARNGDTEAQAELLALMSDLQRWAADMIVQAAPVKRPPDERL